MRVLNPKLNLSLDLNLSSYACLYRYMPRNMPRKLSKFIFSAMPNVNLSKTKSSVTGGLIPGVSAVVKIF